MDSPATRSPPRFDWSCRKCGGNIRCTADRRGTVEVRCPECRHRNVIPHTKIDPIYDGWRESIRDAEREKRNAERLRKREAKADARAALDAQTALDAAAGRVAVEMARTKINCHRCGAQLIPAVRTYQGWGVFLLLVGLLFVPIFGLGIPVIGVGIYFLVKRSGSWDCPYCGSTSPRQIQ